MQSGYLLRDVLDKANEIHFSSSDEIHTLGHFYESMLKEMRDAAGDSGDFYTPRPLVRMIVAVVDPRAGETILDPAAGTAGFLAESFEHLKPLCRTVEEMEQLQRSTLYGIEAKSLIPMSGVLVDDLLPRTRRGRIGLRRWPLWCPGQHRSAINRRLPVDASRSTEHVGRPLQQLR
jgi:hypothetical protein